MKKRVITMLLAAVLVLGNTGTGFAAAEGNFNSCNINSIMGKVWSQLQQYIKLPAGDAITEDTAQKNESAENTIVEGGSNKQGKVSEVVSLVNKERSAQGLGKLSSDSQLNKLAQLKAEDMAAKGYFSHTSPTYGSAFDMMKTYNVSYKTAGENIAKGQKTAEAVMKGWMNSSGHRANILGTAYTSIGVGYAVSSNGTPYWVQIFKG